MLHQELVLLIKCTKVSKNLTFIKIPVSLHKDIQSSLWYMVYMSSSLKTIFSISVLSLCIMTSFSVYADSWENDIPVQSTIWLYVQNIGDFDFINGNFSIKWRLWYVYNKQYIPMKIEEYSEYVNRDNLNLGDIVVNNVGDKQRVQIPLEGTVKQNRKLQNFPFDKQTLYFSIENGNYDASALEFIVDTENSSYEKSMHINGRDIISFGLHKTPKTYESTFGDPTLVWTTQSFYDNVTMMMEVQRQNPWITFFKIFVAPYLAFIICYFGHFIAEKKLDARVGIATWALFATISNKYIVDSFVPQSTSFTLIDQIHTIVLAFIFFSLIMSIFAGKSIEEHGQVDRYDHFMLTIWWPGFIVINIILIVLARY